METPKGKAERFSCSVMNILDDLAAQEANAVQTPLEVLEGGVGVCPKCALWTW